MIADTMIADPSNAALFLTIWTALALLVAGEVGSRGAWHGRAAAAWAWPLSAIGVLLCATHMVLALAVHYGGSHAAAVEATAEQTRAVFGVGWGGGIYANYVFVAVWVVEVVSWRASPARHFARAVRWTWVVRGFWLVILVNATVVFAAPSRRPAGMLLMGVLIWAWSRPPGRRIHRMVEIREAAASDMEAAREIFAEYMESVAHLAARSFAHQRADEELQTLPGKYGPPDGTIVLAWDEGVCVGCVAVRRLDEAGACELKRMYVKPTHRRVGLGRRLCEAAISRARQMGYRQIKLDSDPALHPALVLYRTLGFVDAARYNADPEPDTVYLARVL